MRFEKRKKEKEKERKLLNLRRYYDYYRGGRGGGLIAIYF